MLILLVMKMLPIKLLLWAINNGQYDDLDKEAWRILSDADENTTGHSKKTQGMQPPKTELDDPEK